MTMVGETLRRERLKRNLEFEQISRELKISARFLEAIENDQYEKLPGGVFARSFVRQYARLLGLDEDDLARQLQNAMAPASAIPQFAEKAKPASVSPIQVPRVEEWETVGDKRFRWSGSLSSAAMVVAVMLVCSAFYAWLQRQNSPSITQTAIAQSTPAPAPAPSPVQEAPPPTAPPPSAVETTPVATPVPAPVVDQKPAEPAPETKPAAPKVVAPKAAPTNANATVRVEITAEEPVWVLARSDGKYAFSGTLVPGQTRLVEGVKDVLLRLGNAGGVTVSLNGKPLGPVGPKGQTRTVQLTSGGFQIVPAKPPSETFDPLDRF